MNNNRLLPLILFSLVLVALAVFCKVALSDDVDFAGIAPTFAIGVFSGMIIQKRGLAFLLPLVTVFIADAVIELMYQNNMFTYHGFYPGQWKNYLLLASVTVIVGWLVKATSYWRVALGAVAAPTVFFLISNFIVWVNTTEVAYPKTFSGLLTCYEAALPFYQKGLIGTAVFLPLILLAYNAITKQRTSVLVTQ